MKIQTFSVVIGGTKCNAKCPYCISKQTGDKGLTEEKPNFRNFHKACQFAKDSGVSTVLLTGKGEPLLYPNLITQYLEILDEYKFPFIELQTNGIELPYLDDDSIAEYLKLWYSYGLTTICLSCVHYLDDLNKEIFGNNYGSLKDYIEICHNNKLSVRVSCVMLQNWIGNTAAVLYFINFCKENKVEQFTIRPVKNLKITEIEMLDENGKETKEYEIYKWIETFGLEPQSYKNIQKHFAEKGFLLLELAHGAKVYDYEGQNISLNTCLTHSPNPDDIRQLIFFPDGHLRFSWDKAGAIIL